MTRAEQTELLISQLNGSATSPEALIDNYELTITMDDADVCSAIDNEIFCCEDCGWWCDQSENSTKSEEWICNDCDT